MGKIALGLVLGMAALLLAGQMEDISAAQADVIPHVTAQTAAPGQFPVMYAGVRG